MESSEIKDIDQVLSRGVTEVIPKEEVEKKLKSGKTLRIKFGVDPTSPNIHLGRATILLKLRDLQNLGHKIIFIVGDFTGVIGDTSDKESERPMLSREDIEKNMETYIEQAGKILNMDDVEIHNNSEWLEELTYRELAEQANVFSVAEFIARDNIKRRLEKGSRVSLREMLYPLMVGYDSVKVNADIEVGGIDQKFNLLAGRTMQEHYKQKPQGILTLNLIEGTDGRKMSSSWGNTINLTDKPSDMFGKVMSISDELIVSYFIHITRVPMDEVVRIGGEMEKGGLNPRDAKMKLAKEIVKLCHDEKSAEKAEEEFVSTFQKGNIPEEIIEIKVNNKTQLIDALIESKTIESKTEARRLFLAGSIKNESGEKITDATIMASSGIFKIGKRRFVKIEIK